MSSLSTDEPGLESTQHWVMAAITAPGGLPQGLMRAREAMGWEIGDIVSAPAGVSPHSRLDIYAQGYWLRLFACLKADYPALQRLLGEPLFEFFARAYLDSHPSKSFSLYGLGDGFAQFLRRSQSTAAKSAAEGKLKFPLELARIEQAMSASLRAIGVESQAYEPADPMQLLLGNGVDIELPATTRLVLTSHSLAAFKPWLDDVATDDPPTAATGYIVVKRQRFRVTCDELTDWQFYFLAAARRGKCPLLACAEAAARRTHYTVSELLAKLAFWIPVAQASGLLKVGAIQSGIESPDNH